MPKLATPVLYEDSLDELNMVRPLSMTDKVGVGIDISVLDSESAASGDSVIGRLMRSDNAGRLLVNGLKKQTAFETISVEMYYSSPLQVLTFAQPCNYFTVEVTGIWDGSSLSWKDASGLREIQAMSLTEVNTILVYGDVLVFKGTGIGGWRIDFDVVGFY